MCADRRILACILLPFAAAGCANGDYLRLDGVTPGAGDSAAANTVMQIVDPWQRGVEDTALRTPAVRPRQAADQSADASAAKEE